MSETYKKLEQGIFRSGLRRMESVLRDEAVVEALKALETAVRQAEATRDQKLRLGEIIESRTNSDNRRRAVFTQHGLPRNGHDMLMAFPPRQSKAQDKASAQRRLAVSEPEARRFVWRCDTVFEKPTAVETSNIGTDVGFVGDVLRDQDAFQAYLSEMESLEREATIQRMLVRSTATTFLKHMMKMRIPMVIEVNYETVLWEHGTGAISSPEREFLLDWWYASAKSNLCNYVPQKSAASVEIGNVWVDATKAQLRRKFPGLQH